VEETLMGGWADVDLSLILPVHDEVENLPVLWPEVEQVLWEISGTCEIIFVDDASTDGSTEVIRDLLARDKRVRLIRLARRSGLTAAFLAGFAAARGAVVATMDSDLQNDPRDLPRLLAALDRHDAAVGWRRTRRDPWLKRVSSRIGNAVRDAVTGDRVHDSASSLRVMRRECLGAIPPYQGMHRFVPTLLRMAGYRVAEVPVAHRPRRFGHSKYGVRNRARRAFEDLLAVRWMMRRRLRYEVVEEPAEDR
jgi:glycosyltransferase involved in cell wall biosynthesis